MPDNSARRPKPSGYGTIDEVANSPLGSRFGTKRPECPLSRHCRPTYMRSLRLFMGRGCLRDAAFEDDRDALRLKKWPEPKAGTMICPRNLLPLRVCTAIIHFLPFFSLSWRTGSVEINVELRSTGRPGVVLFL